MFWHPEKLQCRLDRCLLSFLSCQLKPHCSENSIDIEIRVTLGSFLMPPEPFQCQRWPYICSFWQKQAQQINRLVYFYYSRQTQNRTHLHKQGNMNCVTVRPPARTPGHCWQKIRGSHLFLKIKALLNWAHTSNRAHQPQQGSARALQSEWILALLLARMFMAVAWLALANMKMPFRD